MKLQYPKLRQITNYDCGVIVVQEALLHYGIDAPYKHLRKLLQTSKKDGTSVENILKVFKIYNINYGCGEMDIDTLKEQVKWSYPTIIPVQMHGGGHYVTVIGFTGKSIIINDPFSYFNTEIKISALRKIWHDCDTYHSYNNFGITIYK